MRSSGRPRRRPPRTASSGNSRTGAVAACGADDRGLHILPVTDEHGGRSHWKRRRLAVTEDTAEVGESGGAANGAADGTDDSEPETAAITVTVDGTVYVQAGGVGRHPEACPEGFSYAGEAERRTPGSFVPTMPTRSGRGRSMSIRAAGMRGPEPPIWPMSATRRRQQTDRGRKEKAGPPGGAPLRRPFAYVLPVLTAHQQLFQKFHAPGQNGLVIKGEVRA